MAAIRAPSFGSGLRVAVDKTPALFSLEVRAYCLRGLGFTHRQDSRMGYRGASRVGPIKADMSRLREPQSRLIQMTQAGLRPLSSLRTSSASGPRVLASSCRLSTATED